MSESPNYQYVLELAAQHGGKQTGAKVLDFGCGRAQVVIEGLALDLTYTVLTRSRGYITIGIISSLPEVSGKVHKIIVGRLPF